VEARYEAEPEETRSILETTGVKLPPSAGELHVERCTTSEDLVIVRVDGIKRQIDNDEHDVEIVTTRDGKRYSRPLSPFVDQNCLSEVIK
jgi:hypothetical protein